MRRSLNEERLLTLVVLFLLAATFGTTVAFATPPATINIRGQLLDAQGHALSGPRAFRVQFYDAATGGTALGTAITGTAEVSLEGLFNIQALLPPSALLAAEMWYEVAISSGATPGPLASSDTFPNRVKVESVPFALESSEADHVDVSAVGSGTVLSAEFDALSGVLSNVQGQLNAKANNADVDTSQSAQDAVIAAKANSADVYTKTEADGRFAKVADGVPTTAIVLSRTNPNANLAGYTCIGDLDMPGAANSNTWTPTSSGANVPEARINHTAVWTGSQMIVWGGRKTYPTRENTGGRYDPQTDTWTPTSTGANVPLGRIYHTAVWTGSQMIVWGGNAGDSTNTGGLYDPATDTWTPTSTGANVPEARTGHTAVWTGSRMIIWGGFNDGGDLATGGVYDPATDSWTPTSTGANVPQARYIHTAVWAGTQMIVWGGRIGNDDVNTGGSYDPLTDTWTATGTGANVPQGRSVHTAVWTGSRMIVWGGLIYSGNSRLNTGGIYDPVANTWAATSTGASVPEGRYMHIAVWAGSRMIVWGGHNAGYLNTGGIYDPLMDTWGATSTGTNVPDGRTYQTAVWTDSQMIVWGGEGSSPFLNTGAALTWTPTTYYLFQKN